MLASLHGTGVYIGPKSVQRIHFMGKINIDFISRAKQGKNFLISNLFSLNLGPSETQKHLKLCFQFLKIP